VKKAFSSAAASILLAMAGAAPAAADSRVEATLCAESMGVNIGFFMVFDFKDADVLSGPPAEVVELPSPGESVQPWVSFDRGDLTVHLGGGKSLVFGRYFHDGLGFGNDRRPAIFFRRTGEGEKAVGLAGGLIVTTENGRGRRIGETRNMKVNAPDGERTLRAHRLAAGDGRWIVQIGESVCAVGEDGDLTPLCHAGWRRIETPDGRTLVIVMTRGLEKGSPWTGRFEGRLYRD